MGIHRAIHQPLLLPFRVSDDGRRVDQANEQAMGSQTASVAKSGLQSGRQTNYVNDNPVVQARIRGNHHQSVRASDWHPVSSANPVSRSAFGRRRRRRGVHADDVQRTLASLELSTPTTGSANPDIYALYVPTAPGVLRTQYRVRF